MQELNNPEQEEQEVSTIQDALVGKKRSKAVFSVGGEQAQQDTINIEDVMTVNPENEAQENRHLNKRRKLDSLSSKAI